jgi:hypothetical protein
MLCAAARGKNTVIFKFSVYCALAPIFKEGNELRFGPLINSVVDGRGIEIQSGIRMNAY